MVVTNIAQADGTPSVSRYSGRRWHTDMSQTLVPALGSLLRCWKIPAVGGDTLFANTTLAYDTLSPGMQQLVDQLHAVHEAGGRKLDANHSDKAHAAEQKRISPPVAHPVARVHPETGRTVLFYNRAYVRDLVGPPDDEKKRLMEWLHLHTTDARFGYRHRWSPGDLVIWDNRSTQHYALNDYAGFRRELHRTTVAGETPIPA